MKCLSCNAKINPGARFCSECGAKLEIKCPSCNALLTNFSKFCSECGAPLEDSGTVNSTGQKTSENKIRENIDNGDSGYFTDPRDGETYYTVKIGNQVWMAENLAYNIGKDCWAYDEDERNVDIYGRLYSWEAAKRACPSGWHIPSQGEWEQLARYINNKKGVYEKSSHGDWYNLGKHLKAKKGWDMNYDNNKGCGIDDFGFSALPGGIIMGDGFSGVGKYGQWWSSTESDEDKMKIRSLRNSSQNLETCDFWTWYGSSIRCVKD